MAGPASVIFGTNFKSWVSARGFGIALLAALFPLFLSGAWVATHRADVAAESVEWSPQPIEMGVPVEFTATIVNKGGTHLGAFNATLQVGLTGDALPNGSIPFVVKATNTSRIGGLAPGARTTIHLTWTPFRGSEFSPPDLGTFEVLAEADPDDRLGELNELNNRFQKGLEVQYSDRFVNVIPPRTAGFDGDPNATLVSDLSVNGLESDKPELFSNETVTFHATVRNDGPAPVDNASVVMRIREFNQFGGLTEVQTSNQTLSLEANSSAPISLPWVVPAATVDELRIFIVEMAVNVTNARHDPSVDNNGITRPFIVDRKLEFPTPPERATIRGFFISIMEGLQVPLIIPLIGLFYAAGVLVDEREKGNLAYLLTRPVYRPVLPMAKFLVGFAVAALAITIGTLGSFALIFGLNQGDTTYFAAPLALSLLTLFVYGALFTVMGVLLDRPYLVGVAFVLGWEFIAGNLVPWVKNLTLSHHLLKIAGEWRLSNNMPRETLPLPPDGTAALDAVRNMVLAGFAFLAAAWWLMKRREFEV